jgi:hypothetical protein
MDACFHGINYTSASLCLAAANLSSKLPHQITRPSLGKVPTSPSFIVKKDLSNYVSTLNREN